MTARELDDPAGLEVLTVVVMTGADVLVTGEASNGGLPAAVSRAPAAGRHGVRPTRMDDQK
ncbi:hypothetical protein [Streptosporangium vulgare]|uniref:Uncharacterized protein n=1 Tax=Streptosporangium vulgare TaxID=46190 RepID=A0ABV5TPD8_9ACTN